MFSPILDEITVAEVNKAFQSAWNSGNRILSLTGIELEGDQSPQEVIIEAWNDAAKAKVVQWEDEPEVKFPYLSVPEHQISILQRVHNTEQPEPYTYQRTNFSNGLSLLMKDMDVEKGRVRLSFGFGPGTSSMDDREQALARFSINVLGQGGVGRLTRLQQIQVLSGRKVNLSWRMGPSGISLMATCLRDDLDIVMHMMRTAFLDPVVSENDFNSALVMLKNEDSRQAGTCSGVFATAGQRFLTGGAGYLAKLEYEQVSDFTLKDVQSFIAKAFTLGPLSMSVAGDFTPSDMEKMVGRFFGTLPARSSYEGDTIQLAFPAGQRAEERLSRDLPQAGVIVALPVPGLELENGTVTQASLREKVQLQLLNTAVLDRLRVNLREKLGAAYSPRSYIATSVSVLEFAYLAVRVETEAGTTELVEQEIHSIFADLATNGVTEEELTRAKKQALSSKKQYEARLGYWGYRLDSEFRERSGTFAQAAKSFDILRAAKADELSTLAARYLIPEKMAVFTVLPFKENQ